jgi:hypothetical protein
VDADGTVWTDRLLWLETLRHPAVLYWSVAVLALWLPGHILPQTMPAAAAALELCLRRLLPQGNAAVSAEAELRGL